MPLEIKEYEKIYAIEPYHSCGLGGGFIGCNTIEESDFIVHGSSGCGFSMRYGLAQHWKSFIPAPVTNLCDQNVIFGAEKLLENALDDFCIQSGSKICFVLSTCSAEIIGEDYTKICKKAEEKFGKIVIYVETGGTTNLIEGYNNFLFNTVKNIILDSRYIDHYHGKVEGKVNVDVMGIIPMYDMFWRGDYAELERILAMLNINVKSFFTGDTDLNRILDMRNSDFIINLNRSVGKKAINLYQKKMNKKVYTFQYLPIGFKYIEKFMRELGRIVNIDQNKLDELIEKETENAKRIMLRGYDFTKVMFQAGKVAVIGLAEWACPLTNFLVNELGMECALVAFTNKASKDNIDELEGILADCKSQVTVLNNVDNFYIKEILREKKPNLVFGRSLDRIQENSAAIHISWQFPSSNRFVLMDRPIIGYKGIISLVDIIVNAFCEKWY